MLLPGVRMKVWWMGGSGGVGGVGGTIDTGVLYRGGEEGEGRELLFVLTL